MEEKSLYYYHSDHLGSTSYVTDRDGKVSQFVAYLPFGESLYEQHSNTKDMPYLFNGKERDEETGLYYYGSRYYDPWSAVWSGVDPMWSKYPMLSPFVYCANNPVIYVDPTGMEVESSTGGPPWSALSSKIGSTIASTTGSVKTETSYVPKNPIISVTSSTTVTEGEQKIFNKDIQTTNTTYPSGRVETNTSTVYQAKSPIETNKGSISTGIGTDGSTGSLSSSISFFGKADIKLSLNGNTDILNSSVSLSFSTTKDNVTKEFSVGIKPVGIATVVATAILRRIIPPVSNMSLPQPQPIPIPVIF